MEKTIKIDLHGQTVYSAQRLLTQRLKSLAPDVREVCVIFGWHGGTALRDFVMSYKNRKIERKILGLNPGSVILVIKQTEEK